MGTVLLLGSAGPTLNSLSAVLRTLECRVLLAASPGPHAEFIRLALAVAEFCPQETPLAEFAERLRSLAPLPTVVVGPDLPESQVAPLLAPGHVGGYLRLGTPAREKREALRAWLPQEAREVLSVGPLRLDPRGQKVQCGARPLNLTPREFRLLRALMQRPGEWAGSASLAALAACPDVPTHLGHLHRKLAACSAAPLLRVAPGPRYALDARRSPRFLPSPALTLRTHLQHLF